MEKCQAVQQAAWYKAQRMASHVKPVTLSLGYQTPSGGGLAMGEHPVSCQSAAYMETACGSYFS